VPDPAVLTVLVADDSAPFRAAVVGAVRAYEGLELVGEADGGTAALEAISSLHPDVAVLDVNMPGLDGLEVTERLRALVPGLRTKVVLMSARMDDGMSARAREVGADAWLSKTVSRREICAAALRVGRGT
jgi:two-component system nitrate/nitrite response regulator NarL